MSSNTAPGVARSTTAPRAPPASETTRKDFNRSFCSASSARYVTEPPAYPGSSPIEEVMFAVRGWMPAATSAGNVIRVPPPAAALTAPPKNPARAIKMMCSQPQEGPFVGDAGRITRSGRDGRGDRRGRPAKL